MGTAKRVGERRLSATGAFQQVFQLDPPLREDDTWVDAGREPQAHEFVLVSSVSAMFSGPETYIFPCDEQGRVDEWFELPGSYRGGLNHEKALRSAGYEIVK